MTLQPTELLELLKGRAATEGTRRTHGGVLKEKRGKKWVRVPTGKKAAKKPESEVHGSREGVYYSPAFLKGLESTYAEIEKVTGMEYEAASVLKQNGDQEFFLAGDPGKPHEVSMNQYEMKLLMAVCMVHNHPTLDVSFSEQDVYTCLKKQISEIRVISNDHEYIYRPDYKKTHPIRIQETFYALVAFKRAEFWMMMDSGAITKEDAELKFQHEVMVDLVEETGGYYEKRPRSEGLSKAGEAEADDRRQGAGPRVRQETEGLEKANTFSGFKLEGRINWQGLPISIENERGSMRRGEDGDGHEWCTFMHIAYGYVRLTRGVDGDHVDCYVGNSRFSDHVFVVHQNVPETGAYDEDKVMLGFNSAREAKSAYIRQYDRPGFFGTMDELTMVEFKELLKIRKGVKLKKSYMIYAGRTQGISETLVKALVPVIRMVSRKGKTFPMTYWVSPGEAKKMQAEYYKPPAYDEKDTVWIAQSSEIFDFEPTAGRGVDKVLALQNEMYGSMHGGGGVDLSIVREKAARELEYSLKMAKEQGEDVGRDWYTDSLKRLRSVLVQHNPTLANDTEWDFFSLLLAVTSPGCRVSLNLNNALGLYKGYVETGEIPMRQPNGKKWAGSGTTKALTKLKSRIEAEGGRDGLLRWLKGFSTIGDLRKISKHMKGDQDEKVSNATVFGPKVGVFYNNLIGEHGMLTIDMWAARSFYRWSNKIKPNLNSKGAWEVNVKLGVQDRREMATVIESLCTEFDLSMAEMQAVFWYYEKRLYEKIGVRPEETIDYEEAARRAYEGTDPPGSRNNIQTLAPREADAVVSKSSRSYGQGVVGENMSTQGGVPDGTLIKSDMNGGGWFTVVGYDWIQFHPYNGGEQLLEKAKPGVKGYYSPEEVKARGMRWVTIRGARVLLQGTADGGWVVVGGAGGKLNHLRVDSILGKEEYTRKQKESAKQKKQGLRALSQEELSEFKEQRKQEVVAKRGLRSAYTAKVRDIIGVTEADLKSQITADMMDDLTDRAKDIVEGRKRKVLDEGDAKDIEAEKDKIIKSEAQKQLKNVERQAMDVLMQDYLDESDPNMKKTLKQALDNDKAMAILKAKQDFKKAMKDIGVTKDPRPPRLKVGDVLSATATSTADDILAEVKSNVETAKNIALYDQMNAQSGAIQRHVAGGNASAINGILSDVLGGGATFSPDAFKELGVDAIARAVAVEIQKTGRGAEVKKALEAFSDTKREKIIDTAMESSKERLKVADSLRNLARGTDDEEGIMSMAQANGYALKQVVAAQQDLGVAVGSLQAMAHLINALDEPPADSILIEVGSDLRRARMRAKKAGLKRGMYNIRKSKAGGKKLIMEIPADSISQFITNNKESVKKESLIDRIKKHKANTGMTAGDGNMPPGMNENAIHPVTKEEGPIHLDKAQEAGVRFFQEKGKILLDFEAGLGKTPTAYACIMDAMHNKGAKKVLVVTPPKLTDQFLGEASVFLDEENRKLVTDVRAKGGPKKRQAYYDQEKGVDIIGHDQLASDWQAIKAAGYDMIVIDEVHQMTPGGKGKGSQRFRGMMQLSDIPLKIGMSGTNIKNGKVELYKKIAFLDPEHSLGTIAEFDKRYKGLNQGTSAFQDSANDAFRKEISPWVYTQTNTLKASHEHEHIRVPLTENQRSNLREVMSTYRKEKDAKSKGAAARRDAQMYRIVHNDAEANNSKAGEIVRLMRASHVGEKAVVHVSGISAQNSTIKRLQREFGPESVVAISGQPPYDSDAHIRKVKEQFNDPDSPVRFIIGTKSMESGHNLQAGTVNFHLDQPMTYASKDQREKRTYRKGQDKNVKTYTLSGHNPYDLRMEDIVERKKHETEIMGNPQEVEGMDGSGFLSFLNRAEEESKDADSGKKIRTAAN